MKIVSRHDILNAELFTTSSTLKAGAEEVEEAILATDWPHGSGKFSLYPESGKKRGMGNGVDPIKIPCIKALRAKGWLTETLPAFEGGVLRTGKRTGDLDALKQSAGGFLLFEWETGNVSSSHRAVNKLLATMQDFNVLGSFMVVPSDALKEYLTDRIGNIGELTPYFKLWGRTPGIAGGFRFLAVEHDVLDMNVPRIPKRTDGRAQG